MLLTGCKHTSKLVVNNLFTAVRNQSFPVSMTMLTNRFLLCLEFGALLGAVVLVLIYQLISFRGSVFFFYFADGSLLSQ